MENLNNSNNDTNIIRKTPNSQKVSDILDNNKDRKNNDSYLRETIDFVRDQLMKSIDLEVCRNNRELITAILDYDVQDGELEKQNEVLLKEYYKQLEYVTLLKDELIRRGMKDGSF